MNAKITHIQINVSDFEKSKKFYLEMFEVLGWKKLMEEENVISWTSGDFSFWMVETESRFRENRFHRKQTGVNHIAFKVNSKKEVDEFFNKFLLKQKNRVLYNSPKAYPEYTKDYYAVFFEDPDRIKLEVTYH
ncbi:MAG TPA: VOC family protein [Patescibacteria group bacterium]|nr:VOC family protein [Patescibacteria group bacterium]